MATGLKNRHNHEPDEEASFITRARDSLKEAVLDAPFTESHKTLYYRWYQDFVRTLTEQEAEFFIQTFPDFPDIKTQMWRYVFSKYFLQ